ncbi:hypothetical protein ACVW0P_003527 [Mucilaginibacter sp. UYNi724]
MYYRYLLLLLQSMLGTKCKIYKDAIVDETDKHFNNLIVSIN